MNGHGYRSNEPMPVSGQPAQPPPMGSVGNTGEIYGTQQSAKWAVGDTRAKQVCDSLKATALWRLSVFGNVLVTIQYGTRSNREFVRLMAPVVITLPGQFTAYAEPLDDQGASCTVTLTQATAGARSQARKLVTGPATFDQDAVDYFALSASNLVISGVAVAVPALAIVPLVSGSSLVNGSGFQEFEP